MKPSAMQLERRVPCRPILPSPFKGNSQAYLASRNFAWSMSADVFPLHLAVPATGKRLAKDLRFYALCVDNGPISRGMAGASSILQVDAR